MINKKLYGFITGHRHHAYRRTALKSKAAEYKSCGFSPRARMAARFCESAALEAETPHILPNQKIILMRTLPAMPDVMTKDEWTEIKSASFVHELGYISNICPDYTYIISKGFVEIRKTADEYGCSVIDAMNRLCESYKSHAAAEGRTDIVSTLDRIPAYPAETFREALQFFRIIHYALWMEGNYHNTVGRFDKYMMHYLKHDLDAGILTPDSARELLEDFFLSFNIDSDLYPGIQQGDNGQSLMLGGLTEDGTEICNLLTVMCLEVSGDLKLIDPKINLRVTKDTPLSLFEKGSELTKMGLGFPQYSNDDIVINGLLKLGYDYKDAVNYTVAACWEFIIPGCGMEIANIGALSYPQCVDRAVHKALLNTSDFDAFTDEVKTEIRRECESIADSIKSVWFVPSPFMDLLYGGRDISQGAKYNNFGIHGTGISCAADSLAAIKKYLFDEKRYTAAELIDAIDHNFEGYDEMGAVLRYEAPKCGCDDDAGLYLILLTDAFADALEGKKNCRGGCYRGGTGSAMFYLWHAAEIGASPDGRRKGEPFAANFSPSLFAKISDPVDIINSFTAPHLTRVINGGPLTLEFCDRMFAGSDSVRNIALLVKYYITKGGHQLQLNAVNSDKLRDAQKHPEKYKQLIVRVWGWSAYFCELDRDYQNHVIARREYII
ncbi:MAG: pyruvate formate lyase family protein [Eubacteriales bacterium]